MGDFGVRKIIDAKDRRRMYQLSLNDISSFEIMLQEQLFDNGPAKIGAEQELCIVDKQYNPATSALNLLKEINDPHYTNELALFNLEINSDPYFLKNRCFHEMEQSLLSLLEKGKKVAAQKNEQLLLTGILPTLKYRHLEFDYMTPIKRYRTLSKSLSDIRGTHFEINLQGVDEVILSLGTVLFEACNTSFQLHLQIDPNDFVNKHNWSQMIAGPVLAGCVNSPMLFGNELLAETRIALFKQSLDTRSAQRHLRRKLSRVYFGKNWIQSSPAELWKNDITRFPLIVTSDDLEDSLDVLRRGEIPDLRGIRLHNGTTYTWNRMCYGFSKKKPHLRIECRYLPAGPTVIDEMANFAFWIGLMNCEPEGGKEFWKKLNFRSARNNFEKASRTGLSTVFNWYDKNIPAKELLLDTLIPMAQKGLEEVGVSEVDIQHYLTVFSKRIEKEITGSDWTVKNFRMLKKKYGDTLAEKEIVKQTLLYQNENLPVHEWDDISCNSHSIQLEKATVEQLMTKDIISINENAGIELAKSILQWNDIHHLPVENDNGDLVGIITNGMMERLAKKANQAYCYAKDIMIKDVQSVQSDHSIKEVKTIMAKYQLSGIPIVYKKKLVGIVTNRDFKKWEK